MKSASGAPLNITVHLVIDALDAGGTQRFASLLASGLVDRGVSLTVTTLTGGQQRDFFSLPPTVRRMRLAFDRPRGGRGAGKVVHHLKSLRTLRTAIRSSRPDVVLALGWSTNVITLLSTSFLRLPIVISERADPGDHRVGRVWRLAQRLTYPYATRLVVQTVGVKTRMRSWVLPGRIVVLPNPVPSHLFDIERAPTNAPHIVTIGRLSEQKGLETLIAAFGLLHRTMPSAQLSIVGDGPLRSQLEAAAAVAAPEGSVVFHGQLKDPTSVARTAWCGCLASRLEGFPNALLEMMAIGLPVVSTDCRSGPREILERGAGVLVPVDDVSTLGRALTTILENPATAAALSSAARVRAADFIDVVILDDWAEMLRDVVRRRSGS